MNVKQTGIATALAVGIVGFFLIVPLWWPFGESASATDQSASVLIPSNETSPQAPMPSATELQASDLQAGSGATAEAGDTITVNYVGALTNGQVFDASANHGDKGFTFVLGAGQVIPGWDQGLLGMKEGGVRRLVIPAALAYGSAGVSGVIPPNSTLLFEVQLVKVEKKK